MSVEGDWAIVFTQQSNVIRYSQLLKVWLYSWIAIHEQALAIWKCLVKRLVEVPGVGTNVQHGVRLNVLFENVVHYTIIM